MEVISPGALPHALRVETMRYRQFTRNQLLASFVSRMRSGRTGRAFIEERGEGVELIIRRSAALAGREPEYALHGDEFLLTIWGHPFPHDAR
jgi:predicted HTH transcriptional regulator